MTQKGFDAFQALAEIAKRKNIGDLVELIKKGEDFRQEFIAKDSSKFHVELREAKYGNCSSAGHLGVEIIYPVIQARYLNSEGRLYFQAGANCLNVPVSRENISKIEHTSPRNRLILPLTWPLTDFELYLTEE